MHAYVRASWGSWSSPWDITLYSRDWKLWHCIWTSIIYLVSLRSRHASQGQWQMGWSMPLHQYVLFVVLSLGFLVNSPWFQDIESTSAGKRKLLLGTSRVDDVPIDFSSQHRSILASAPAPSPSNTPLQYGKPSKLFLSSYIRIQKYFPALFTVLRSWSSFFQCL